MDKTYAASIAGHGRPAETYSSFTAPSLREKINALFALSSATGVMRDPYDIRIRGCRMVLIADESSRVGGPYDWRNVSGIEPFV